MKNSLMRISPPELVATDLVSGAALLNHDLRDMQATILLNQTDVTHLLLYVTSDLLFQ
ncbi:hypothetical protein [Xanthomonas sp. NCPPB 1128]|uniref:hypothetical protein n=1 Tax=Xanthomonas sp. NCPPB 1128 TaxID=1775876 RepID=UPI0012FF02A4|nr:hypothetical protein [Xanthomonas sp. NCPPB 1128]